MATYDGPQRRSGVLVAGNPVHVLAYFKLQPFAVFMWTPFSRQIDLTQEQLYIDRLSMYVWPPCTP